MAKFIADPLAVAIVATWYYDEMAEPEDVSRDDILDMLDAAMDEEEIKIVKKALKK